MCPTPLKYSPMIVRTLRALISPNWTGQPPQGLSPSTPWVQGPKAEAMSLLQWSACPPLPLFLLYLAIPALPSHAWPWPVLFSMDMSNAQGLFCLQMCPKPALLPGWGPALAEKLCTAGLNPDPWAHQPSGSCWPVLVSYSLWKIQCLRTKKYIKFNKKCYFPLIYHSE